jgi:hypothetical protein
MLTLRYHIVSLVAVFLALAIGVVVGTTVIDSVLVDRLERQQDTLAAGIDELQQERDALRVRLARLEEADAQLSEEGSQRLLAGVLTNVPVLIVGVRGVESDALDDLVLMLGTAGATYQGTLWFDEQLALEDADTAAELARALGLSGAPSPEVLRGLTLSRVAGDLQAAASATALDPPPTFEDIAALRSAGFVDYEPPDGEPDDITTLAAPGTRVVVVGGEQASVPDDLLARPFTVEMVNGSDAPPRVLTVAVEGEIPEDGVDRVAPFVEPLRSDEAVAGRVSTVDNIDEFAGRLATLLAVQDLTDLRFGHYGQGPGATRLLPPPAPEG